MHESDDLFIFAAKGRTNRELREKFILPAGSSQSMTAFKSKRAPAANRLTFYFRFFTFNGKCKMTGNGFHCKTLELYLSFIMWSCKK